MKSLEQKALELKCMLAVMAGVDTDNTAALVEMPVVAGVALELAEILYSDIIEVQSKGGTVE